jgi:hypothetical protein
MRTQQNVFLQAAQSKYSTLVRESDFLHMTRINFRCPFLKVSFSFNPAVINETTSGWTASDDTEAHDPKAERAANFTSSIPVTR